jgi:hypothetical protein
MRARTLILAAALAGLAAAPRGLSAQGMPSPHDSTWLWTHKEQASGPTCAMCHQREFCASCHVNARNIEAIRAMPSSDSAAAQYRNRRWTYTPPASHHAADWSSTHGPTARQEPNTCATCHARESCMSCHRVEERLLPIALLPRASRGGARGVDLSGLRPESHTPTFARDHRIVAASNADASCRTCHTQAYCSTCHDGARTPTFHQTDYVQRHAADAFTRETDCASCHQTQAFCVQCHRSVGTAAAGRFNVGDFTQFHDKRADWSISHGRVARRSIETCASCHRQSDCVACHAENGYARINPHPAGLDLSRMQDKNRATCLICHTAGAPTPP